MTEEQMVRLIQQLVESGVIEQLPGPANPVEKYLVYAPLILLSILSFKYFIVNGIINKILNFLECHNNLLVEILTVVQDVREENKEENRRIKDVLNLMGNKRRLE